MQRIEIAARHARYIKRIEGFFVNKIYRLTIDRVQSLIHTLRHGGVARAKNQIDSVFIDAELIEIFQDLYTTVGAYSYNLTTRQINKSVKEPEKKYKIGGFGFDEPLFQAIVNYFRIHILNKAVLPYTQTQRDIIRLVLEQGIRDGLGVDDITRKIVDEIKLDRYIIERVVRTEAQFAMQYGRQEAQDNSRWQSENTWISANDHRTRHSHRDVDGDKVDVGKRFRVPIYSKGEIIGFDFMLGPGDIDASAGNVINCRCTMFTAAKRDKNGRLILKKDNNSGISVILPGEVFHPHTVITI